MEAHMADTKDKHRSLEDRLAIVEDRIRRLESVRSGLHSEKTIFPPDAMCTSKQNVLRPVRTVETNGESHNSREPTEPPIAMELSTPILGLKVVKEPAVAASSDVRDISTDIHGIVKTDQPARRSKLASSVRQAQNDQQYHDEPHQPHPDTQKPSLELNDQTLNIESSKTEQSTLREFDLHRISGKYLLAYTEGNQVAMHRARISNHVESPRAADAVGWTPQSAAKPRRSYK